MNKLTLLVAALLLTAAGCGEAPDPTASSAVPHGYHSDIENTVILAVRRGEIDEDLLQEIGNVARRHGLQDWTSSDETFTAIGVGLQRSGADALEAVFVAKLVSEGDPSREEIVLQAFDSGN